MGVGVPLRCSVLSLSLASHLFRRKILNACNYLVIPSNVVLKPPNTQLIIRTQTHEVHYMGKCDLRQRNPLSKQEHMKF